MGGGRQTVLRYNEPALPTRTDSAMLPRKALPRIRVAPRGAGVHSHLLEIIIAKNQNTYAKRQREADKKRKAEEKRTRRRNKPPMDNTADTLPPERDDSQERGDAI